MALSVGTPHGVTAHTYPHAPAGAVQLLPCGCVASCPTVFGLSSPATVDATIAEAILRPPETPLQTIYPTQKHARPYVKKMETHPPYDWIRGRGTRLSLFCNKSRQTMKKASQIMCPLILDRPSRRSVNTMGTSTILNPRRHKRCKTSI